MRTLRGHKHSVHNIYNVYKNIKGKTDNVGRDWKKIKRSKWILINEKQEI